jgi:transcriptional regulator with XRE-family HTH domain
MNRGALALAEKLEGRGDQQRLAEELGIDQGYLSRIARSVKVPGLGVRRKIEQQLGIPMQAWDEEAA